MKTLAGTLSLFTLFLTMGLPWASASEFPKLFSHGGESFRVVDNQSRPVSIRVLKDSFAKQALAMALTSSLKQKDPKVEVTPYLDLKLQTITLTPASPQADNIVMKVFISGQEIEIGPRLKRQDLLAGKRIAVSIGPKQSTAAVFEISSKVNFVLRFDPLENHLLIENLLARAVFSNPMSAEESEEIKFSGRGIRN